jgi:hypothetical protein
MEIFAWQTRLCQIIAHLENTRIPRLPNPWRHHNAFRVLNSTTVQTGESLILNSPFLALMFALMVTFAWVAPFTTPTWMDRQSSSAPSAGTAQEVSFRLARRQKTCAKLTTTTLWKVKQPAPPVKLVGHASQQN